MKNKEKLYRIRLFPVCCVGGERGDKKKRVWKIGVIGNHFQFDLSLPENEFQCWVRIFPIQIEHNSIWVWIWMWNKIWIYIENFIMLSLCCLVCQRPCTKKFRAIARHSAFRSIFREYQTTTTMRQLMQLQ